MCVCVFTTPFVESKIVASFINKVNCFTKVRGREKVKNIFNVKKKSVQVKKEK